MTTFTLVRESTTDYESRREAKMAKARSILEDGFGGVTQGEEALKRYLRFRAHFRSYSRRNTIMLLAQRPAARFCKGYRQWQKHDRQVKKGESGLMIWIPMLRKPTDEEVEEDDLDPDERVLRGFRIGYVFDYEQTEATSEDALTYQSPIPDLDGSGHAMLYSKLCEAATDFGFGVEHEDLAKEGYCDHRNQVIGIRQALPTASKAATLAHELAHAVAHRDANDLSRAERELQAEGAAYLACYALGLDTSKASLPYLAHYERNGEDVAAHLDAIDRVAWQIVDTAD